MYLYALCVQEMWSRNSKNKEWKTWQGKFYIINESEEEKVGKRERKIKEGEEKEEKKRKRESRTKRKGERDEDKEVVWGREKEIVRKKKREERKGEGKVEWG